MQTIESDKFAATRKKSSMTLNDLERLECIFNTQ